VASLLDHVFRVVDRQNHPVKTPEHCWGSPSSLSFWGRQINCGIPGEVAVQIYEYFIGFIIVEKKTFKNNIHHLLPQFTV